MSSILVDGFQYTKHFSFQDQWYCQQGMGLRNEPEILASESVQVRIVSREAQRYTFFDCIACRALIHRDRWAVKRGLVRRLHSKETKRFATFVQLQDSGRFASRQLARSGNHALQERFQLQAPCGMGD